MGDHARPCEIGRQNQKRVQPTALRDGRRQENRGRHLLDDGVGIVVKQLDRVFDLATVDRLPVAAELNAWIGRQSLAQPLDVLVEFGPYRSQGATAAWASA